MKSMRQRIQQEEQAKAKANVRAKERQAQYVELNAHDQPKAAPVANLQDAVIEHQDEISTFLRSRNFGKDEVRIRAILVEFVKHAEQMKIGIAA